MSKKFKVDDLIWHTGTDRYGTIVVVDGEILWVKHDVGHIGWLAELCEHTGEPEKKKRTCICDIIVLWNHGCQCGGKNPA